MNYKILLYGVVLITTTFALTGINYTNFFRTNHKIEAKIFIILVAMSISYLVSQFLLVFFE